MVFSHTRLLLRVYPYMKQPSRTCCPCPHRAPYTVGWWWGLSPPTSLLSAQRAVGCKPAPADGNRAGRPRCRRQTSTPGRTYLGVKHVKWLETWYSFYSITNAPARKVQYSSYTLHSAREAPPVGEHHERQTFAVEVTDRLSGFKGRIWKPHLTSLLQNLTPTHTVIRRGEIPSYHLFKSITCRQIYSL